MSWRCHICFHLNKQDADKCSACSVLRRTRKGKPAIKSSADSEQSDKPIMFKEKIAAIPDEAWETPPRGALKSNLRTAGMDSHNERIRKPFQDQSKMGRGPSNSGKNFVQTGDTSRNLRSSQPREVHSGGDRRGSPTNVDQNVTSHVGGVNARPKTTQEYGVHGKMGRGVGSSNIGQHYGQTGDTSHNLRSRQGHKSSKI